MMQGKADLQEMLTRIPLFAGLSAAELASLSSRFHLRPFRKRDTIIRLDEPGDSFFVIRSGKVKVSRPVVSGGEMLIDVLGPREFFGEMSLLDQRERSASVTALEATETLVLYRADFLQYLQTHPPAALAIIVVLADRIRRLNAQVEEAYFMVLAQRLARRLLDLGQRRGRETGEGLLIQASLTQSDLASMVGGSRQRVNRVLADWQDRGVLRLGARGDITILRRDILSELCL